MRIIAGEFRGRKLLAPEGQTTRPITDRVKQSVFDILAPRIDGAVVYDCFAGTGSMGLECLSRGAQAAVFFETDRSALGLLRRNISAMKVQERCEVVAADIFRCLEIANRKSQIANLVFLDPPYRFLRERADDLRALAARIATGHLADDGLVVFRHDATDTLELPALRAVDIREYGGMMVEFLGRR